MTNQELLRGTLNLMCPTVVLMRDGCKCGCARKGIEQEFKREG